MVKTQERFDRDDRVHLMVRRLDTRRRIHRRGELAFVEGTKGRRIRVRFHLNCPHGNPDLCGRMARECKHYVGAGQRGRRCPNNITSFADLRPSYIRPIRRHGHRFQASYDRLGVHHEITYGSY